MNRNNCENLTSAIQNLQTLQQRVDSATNSFEPEDGVLAKDEAMKILELYKFHNFFKKETYDFFIKAFGSEKEFKNHFAIIETTGKSGRQILKDFEQAEFDSKKIFTHNNTENILRSPDFEVVRAGEKIATLRLRLGTLFSDENARTTYAEVLARAKELGLEFLPHETAIDLLLDDKTQLELYKRYVVVSSPIVDLRGTPRVFYFCRDDHKLWLSDESAEPGWPWRADSRELVFGLRKLEN
jgi:hypothetical protein